MKYIIALDQGTTGTTSALIDAESMKFVDKVNEEFPQILPKPGHVEHNLDDIWKSTLSTLEKLLVANNVSPEDISCIGLTNQRETTCAFDKSGAPLANAIVWQDRRTEPLCEQLKERGLASTFQKKSGLPLDPYFSGTKMKWLLDNNETVQRHQKEGTLHLGTIDTYLLFRLTGGESFLTEPSNASRTLLMNLETTDWDDELLDTLGIHRNLLPKINDSFSSFGKTKNLGVLPDGIPITGILGDQQAALFGQAGINEGDSKCTYGTGAFMLLNTGENIKYSENGLLTTVAYRESGKTYYALEGSCYIAGAAVQWLRDNLKLIPSSPDVENTARQVSSLEQMNNILFMPFFTGLGSPYWVSDAKAAILGLSRDSGVPHIARACLEGIALSINDLVTSMEKDANQKILALKVDGGAVVNNLLMQLQSNFSDLQIIRPSVIETTAYGAALAAAIGNSLFTKNQIQGLWNQDASFSPEQVDSGYYTNKKSLWSNYIEKLFL